MSREAALRLHEKLVGEGWLRRFTAEEPRLSEMREFYESLGLEVRAEAFVAEEGQACQSCFDVEGFGDRYKTLYTRGEESDGKSKSDDLFD
jgi:hypothetical protein